jgi:hypothetical protein
MANKLTTLGYFKKRMRDSGYIVDDSFRNYSQMDPRAWTVIIDPGVASVFCTCFVNANKDDLENSQVGDFYFELHDGGQYIPSHLMLKTSSIEVLIEYLVKFGINNKAAQYNNNQQYVEKAVQA